MAITINKPASFDSVPDVLEYVATLIRERGGDGGAPVAAPGAIPLNIFSSATTYAAAAANTSLLQALLNGNVDVRETFLIPQGTWYFTTLTIRSYKHLKGVSMVGTILKQDVSVTGSFINVGRTDGTNIDRHCALSDMAIDLQSNVAGKAGTDTTNHAVMMYCPRTAPDLFHDIRNISVRNCRGAGLYADTHGEIQVHNYRVYNTSWHGIYWNSYDCFLSGISIGLTGDACYGLWLGPLAANTKINGLKAYVTGNKGTPDSSVSHGILCQARGCIASGVELQDIRGHGIVFDKSGSNQARDNNFQVFIQNVDLVNATGRAAVVFNESHENLVMLTFDNKYNTPWMSATVRYEGTTSPLGNMVIATGNFGPFNGHTTAAYEESASGYMRNNGLIVNGVNYNDRTIGRSSTEAVASGNIGQLVALDVDYASAQDLSSGGISTIGSVLVPAGKWRATFQSTWIFGSGAAATYRAWGVNSSAALPGNNTEQRVVYNGTHTPGAVYDQYQSSTFYLDLAADTTMYLVASGTFSGGAISVAGAMRFERYA